MITRSVIRDVARRVKRSSKPLFGGLALPRTGLLCWLRSVNSDNVLNDESTATLEDLLNAGYALPVSCYVAAGGTGFWFSDSTTPITKTMSQIIAWAGINEYHVLASATKGLAVYDPYTTPDATLSKAHRVMKQTLDVRPTIHYNGAMSKEDIVDAGGTYTGGSVYVPDHLGVLRSPGADQPAVDGLRLATTVAEGALLGPELVVNGGFDSSTGWSSETGWTIASGKLSSANTITYGPYSTSTPIAVGKKCRLTFDLVVASGSVSVRCGGAQSAAISTSGAHAVELTTSAAGNAPFQVRSAATGFTGSIDNISVKEIIPTYLDTTSTGTPIIPYTNVQTRTSGTILDGSELGPELAINGDMSSPTGWTFDFTTQANISGGKLNFIAGGNSPDAFQSGYVANGKRYKITFTLDNIYGVGASVRIKAGATGTLLTSRTEPGTYTEYVTWAVASTAVILFATATTTAVIDNLSIKEVLPAFTNVFTDSTTVKDYTPSNPLTAPLWLCEPARTNYALQSATPVTHTTGSIPAGTYCLWCEGGTSVTATAGTAVGTFGAATPGVPKTITITTAGTVVLTVAGVVTWVQLESGAFPTSRIPTTTGSITRAGCVETFPTLGKIRSNNQAHLQTFVPRATGQSSIYLFGCYTDASNYTAIIVDPTVITYRKRTAGVNTDATVSIAHTKDVPLQICRVGSSLAGMQIAARQYTGGAWSAWTDGTAVTTTAAKANAIIGSTYQIGALNSLGQPSGNLSELISWLIPDGISSPLTLAKKEFGV